MGHRCFSLLLLLALLLPVGCSTNAATGRQQLNILGQDEEIRMGQESGPQFLQSYGGPIPSQRLRDYVTGVGKRLAAQSERASLPWEFHAVDSAVVNAFALPGGKVFITRALLSKFQSEAELAGVLGHEIGHVTAEHIGQQMTQQLGVTLLAIGIGVAGEQTDKDWLKVLGAGTQIGGSVYLLSFGRGQESQADELGVRYMTRLGYNPVGQLRVMEVLQKEAGSGRQLEFLSTHPYPETRIKDLNALIRSNYPDYAAVPPVYKLNAAEYKANVLDELAKLPPPKHNPSSQQPNAAAYRAR